MLKKLSIFIFSFFFIVFNQITYVYPLENQPKVIYLTFDDGPSSNTDKILDILKEEEVCGTFFLMGKLINNSPTTVKRIFDEGSAIGLHSFSHERCIYNSKEKFLEEMLKTQKIIENIIGEKVCIIRFPFGTNNMSFKLKNDWVTLLHENSLKIYDWTQDTGDGTNVNLAPNLIFKNSISKDNNIVLLMHCAEANNNSVKALPEIIKYYKSKGYEFKTITPDTPELYKVKK
ncbi:polysaccharide deacetylase family protein [Clostridium massiliamazoniense]|uniref:polysaccharide deacetylase family protein n=1 Tax=Clostridium massiliamazoniense TaxID=1347366 RepID=UPI0006D7D24B|nr:polysaccharide deacetylase family protein [Clostridium massiliamazoniense]